MASAKAEAFMKALQASEQAKDAGPLVERFAAGAELGKLGSHPSGDPAAFWGEYLAAFADIRSEFTLVVEGDGGSVLEWTSTGTTAAGKPVTYRGVSVLEWDGDMVRKFRTYYDTAPFVQATDAKE